MATSTLAPVTSSRPDVCTCITARWITRWKPAVGLDSSLPSLTRFSSSFDICGEAAAQLVDVDIAGPHHGGGVLVVDQREQQMLERGIFVVPFVGEREGPVEGLL